MTRGSSGEDRRGVPRLLSFTGMLLSFTGLLFLVAVGCDHSSTFPDQPITLICPWSAGGGTDRISRQVASQLERELGVPVSVINATGGAGVTGHTRGALARPDGYTIAMVTAELNMLHWRGLTNITYREFAPLVLLVRESAAIFVRQDSPYRTIDDLQEALASEPGALRAGGTAQGGIWHVALAGWMSARGLAPGAATWISINGAGPSLQELIAGGLDFVCCSLPEADALLSGGKVRSLGLMADARLPAFPSVPTLREQGHDWSMAGWLGLVAPRETPRERLAVLEAAAQRVSRSDELNAFMRQGGFNFVPEPADGFGETMAHQDEVFGRLLTSDAFSDVAVEHFGPMLFPIAIFGLLVLTLTWVVAQETWLRRGADELPLEEDRDVMPIAGGELVGEREWDAGLSVGGEMTRATLGRPIAILIAVVFYALVAEHLGFLLAAFVLLLGLLWRFGVRPVSAIAVAGVTSVVTYQLFAIGLRVPLPRGLLEW